MPRQNPNLSQPKPIPVQQRSNPFLSELSFAYRCRHAIALTTFCFWLSGVGLLARVAQSVGSTSTTSQRFLTMERSFEKEFEDFFGEDLAQVTQGPADVAQTLLKISQETGTQPAVLWVVPRTDHLHLVLLLPGGKPITRDLYNVPRSTLLKTAATLRDQMSEPDSRWDLKTAQQLHQWLIAPFEQEHLQPAKIDTLLLCLGDGMRGLPLAALHDGQRYLVEKYSLSIIPAFNLIQTNYQRLKQGKILAAGASEFMQMNALPAVPVEISTILRFLQGGQASQTRWQGQSLLNQTFTLANLKSRLHGQRFNIVHLATHAEFNPGQPHQSYIQFRDTRLNLDQMDTVEWSNPSLDLLVLSACQTALGDGTAELGFAGVALKSGVKTALGSLWYISDVGTLAVMSEFYQQLTQNPTKAAALRQAQLQMLHKKVRIEGKNLILSNTAIPLSDELLANVETDFSHPFYWSGFTMISSPW
ncbi:MAG: CHAT domain-containing protein [Acaryochloris sp. RU_4_1]|nr:CHAT domain-containing protein [Acaryochloris sp. RU_4_1]NJR53864.1 CHAT domain-containing protein [Acaryochloris sp. CRU_2_0]